ncbi:DUF3618 domain-containing protein [Roseovarius sp. 2305UL8-3]|uniref:DUF3618 domain-containing protein n=1 Tax=Roseovarius conchicola TaxID=3121636 RepID=UPI00352966DA
MADLDTLEAQVEQDRAALSRSLDALTATVAPDHIAQQIGSTAQAYGGELGTQAWRAARDNPAAFALVGAGLGLLLTGAGTRDEKAVRRTNSVAPNDALTGFDQRVAKADAEMKEEMTGMIDPEPKASRLRAALDHGLDKLPDASRNRVMKAREAAIEAQEKVEAQAARMARKTKTFAHEQPLAVGALALGVGALIGALMPSSRKEDELMGAHRDALMRDAEKTLRAEMEKLGTGAMDQLSRHTA